MPVLMFSQVNPAGTTTVSPSANACLKAAIQSLLVNGYDHHFCVDGAGLRRAAVLRGDSSGIAARTDKEETNRRRVIFFSIQPQRYSVCSRLANWRLITC